MFMQFHNSTAICSGQRLGQLHLVFYNCYFLYVPFTELIFAAISQETLNAARTLLLLSLS
jgi:nitrate reductase gamma subunit